MDLVSFEQLKTMLNLEGNTIDDYPQIKMMRDSVAAAIENFLGRKMVCGCGVYRERFTLPFTPTTIVFLNVLPVHTINRLVHVKEDLEEVLIEEYVLAVYGITLKQRISGGYLIVDYVGGSNTVPEDINRAALLQTKSEIARMDYIGTPVSMEHSLGVSVTIPEIELTAEIKRLLHSHQHPRFNNSFNESLEIV